MSGINHPTVLLAMWREEAARLLSYPADDVLITRARALMQCADELERRLVWTGLMTPEGSGLMKAGRL